MEPAPPELKTASIQPLVMLSKPKTPSIPGAMSATSHWRSLHVRSIPWSVGTWTASIMNTGASREPPTPPTDSARVYPVSVASSKPSPLESSPKPSAVAIEMIVT